VFFFPEKSVRSYCLLYHLSSCSGDLFQREVMEALSFMWGNFTLSEREDAEVKIGDDCIEPISCRGQSCLVGKLLADRVVPRDYIRVHMMRAWKTLGAVGFKMLGDNLFLMEFENSWEKINILEGRPWLFDGNLFAVMPFDGLTPPSELVFEKAAFWVRMYNLPLACMGSDIGKQIGATVGEVVEVDQNDGEVEWGEFLRVRIIIDLTKPLDRGRIINIRNKSTWVMFKYEKLPNFCYHCGVVRHSRRGCVAKSLRGEGSLSRDTPFGPWLRVPPVFRRWKGDSGSGGKGSSNLSSEPKVSSADDGLMAAEMSSGGSGDPQNSNCSPGQQDRRESGDKRPGSSGLSVLKLDIREINSLQHSIDPVTEGAFQKRKDCMAGSEGVEKEKTAILGCERIEAEALNDSLMGETIFIPADEAPVNVQEMEQNSLKGRGSGPPSRYVGNWDSDLGRMKWQAMGDGLHEVQLQWDPKAASYFPSVVPKILKQEATRKPFISSSKTGKEKGPDATLKDHRGSTRKLGNFLHGQSRNRKQKWKQRKEKLQKEDCLVGTSDLGGDSQDGKRKLVVLNDGGFSNKQRRHEGCSNPGRSTSAEAVEQPRREQ
jgi:hypothetical protein